jgi:hypothetical protein
MLVMWLAKRMFAPFVRHLSCIHTTTTDAYRVAMIAMGPTFSVEIITVVARKAVNQKMV